jgi:hypothetical protein
MEIAMTEETKDLTAVKKRGLTAVAKLIQIWNLVQQEGLVWRGAVRDQGIKRIG